MENKKKQFTLSLLMRILLGILIVVSIGIFANSVMRYNQLKDEEKELRELLDALNESRYRLESLLDSREEAEELFRCYEEYSSMTDSDSEIEATMEEIQHAHQKREAELLFSFLFQLASPFSVF